MFVVEKVTCEKESKNKIDYSKFVVGGSSGINKVVGYIPQGLGKIAALWNAPVPDYAFKGWENAGLSKLSFAYIVSAGVGIILVAGCVYLIAKFLTKK